MTETDTELARARALNTRGLALLQKGRSAEAIPHLQAAAAATPSAQYFNDLAVAYLQAGQPRQALPLLKQTIAKFPDAHKPRFNLAKLLALQNQPEAGLEVLAAISDAEMEAEGWMSRGMVFYKLGRREDTIRNLDQVRKMCPQDIPVRHMLAKCYNETNQWAEALRVLSEAEQISETRPGANLTLQHFLMKGWAAQHLRQLNNAIKAYSTALKIDPENDIADQMLAQIYAGEHIVERALRHYDRLSARHPDTGQYHVLAAQALNLLKRHDATILRADMALKIDPENFAAMCLRAEALANSGREAETEATVDRITETFPERAKAWIARGDNQLILGKTAAAEASYRKAQALDPHIAVLYRRLADVCKNIKPDDPLMTRIRTELKRDNLTLAEQSDLHMALASTLDRNHLYTEAFSHFEAGNRCRHEIMTYKEQATLFTLERVQESFPADPVPGATPRRPAPHPVFVVGMPRSGTTLVEQILATHTEVYGAGERPDVTVLTHILMLADPASWRDAPQNILDKFAEEYRKQLLPLAPKAHCIIDKMPHNGIYAGLIHRAMPDARFIWIERNAMDSCFSCYKQIFGGDLPYTYDQAELGRYTRAFNGLMAHWENIFSPEVFLHIHYEELIKNPEVIMRQMIAFCGLEWQEQCLHFEKTKRPITTASVAQVRQPLDRKTGGRWKPYAAQLQVLQDALAGKVPL